MRRLTFSLLVAAGTIVVAATSFAAETPEEAVRAFYSDRQSRGLASVPDHLHPEALAAFREMLLPPFEEMATPNAKQMLSLFGPNATTETVRNLSPAEFMRTFLSLADRQLGLRSIQFRSVEVLGSVQEGPVTHVVVRSGVSSKGVTVATMEVVSVKKDGTQWRLLLSSYLEGVAIAIRGEAESRK